jgi:predicted AlkP superfamily pyrophosphatase or phosphodiesterase
MRKRIFKLTALLFLLTALFWTANAQAIRDLRPTVILISIDGLRHDYLDKYKPRNLNRLARAGVRARWMTPAFPSLTFPNHYTIATGLYPQNHGIVGNSMYDARFDATFSLGRREEVQNGRWWGGEPIWVTAEKQNVRAGAFFFPGTEAEIAGVRPTFWKEFDDKFPNNERVDTILAWLDLPAEKRPQFYTLYFSDVDHAGHDYSPDAPETGKAVRDVDAVLGRLLDGLKKREIYRKVNLIIVSDHGMATVKPTNYVAMDDYLDASLVERTVTGGQLWQVYPKAGAEDALMKNLAAKPPAHARCYRKADIPARFHYQTSDRIAPVVCMADEGWNLSSRARLEKEKADGKSPKRDTGSHGYDNALPSMRATFIAHGAAFKKRAIVKPFESVHVYNIMTRILNLTPAANDGNLTAARAVLKNFKD